MGVRYTRLEIASDARGRDARVHCVGLAGRFLEFASDVLTDEACPYVGGGSSTPGKSNFGRSSLRILVVCKPLPLPLPRVPRFAHEWRRLVCAFPFKHHPTCLACMHRMLIVQRSLVVCAKAGICLLAGDTRLHSHWLTITIRSRVPFFTLIECLAVPSFACLAVFARTWSDVREKVQAYLCTCKFNRFFLGAAYQNLLAIIGPRCLKLSDVVLAVYKERGGANPLQQRHVILFGQYSLYWWTLLIAY